MGTITSYETVKGRRYRVRGESQEARDCDDRRARQDLLAAVHTCGASGIADRVSSRHPSAHSPRPPSATVAASTCPAAA